MMRSNEYQPPEKKDNPYVTFALFALLLLAYLAVDSVFSSLQF